MKKAVFLILALFTYYLAGMYRSMALLVLCVGEFMLFLFSFVLPHYFQGKLSVFFSEASKYTDQEKDTPCQIFIQNKSRLPVSRFELRLCIRYFREKKYVKTKLYGSAGQGESSFTFHVTGQYCGMAQVRIDRLKIFDYLSLFHASRELKEEMKIAVFPGEEALHIKFTDFGRDTSTPLEEWTSNWQGEDFNEIRQIREYKNGDMKRHIHWNLSAKTDNMWIKEYERQTDERIPILIESKGFSQISAMEMSAFYQVLSALVRGLLQKEVSVQVHWYQADRECFGYMDVADVAQCQEMLLKLYQVFLLSADKNVQEEAFNQNQSFYQCALRLTSGLALLKGDTLIYQFSPQKLDSELKGVVLVV